MTYCISRPSLRANTKSQRFFYNQRQGIHRRNQWCSQSGKVLNIVIAVKYGQTRSMGSQLRLLSGCRQLKNLDVAAQITMANHHIC